MKFFLLALLIGMPIWALTLPSVRAFLGAIPAKVWLAAVIGLFIAGAFFVFAYGGDGIRLF